MLVRLLNIHQIKHSIFLFGPRGTGKTLWVKSVFKNAIYIDLLNYRDYSSLQADPVRLSAIIAVQPEAPVIIDEVQKVPQLLDEVHRLIEHQGRMFILTGSSSRKLKRAGVNLLAGRALTYSMHPLIYQEIGETFNLEKALKFGLLPASYLSTEPQHFLDSYVATYLREEVLHEGLVRNLGAFSRFMEVASFSQGNQINMLSIAREVGISRKIVEGYFEILKDLLLASELPCFTKRAQRKLVQHPKFYYFDAGVFQAIRPKGPLDSPQEIAGAAFETLFLQHLQAIIAYNRLDLKIYFWRTVTGLEVDFIVYGSAGLFAFELKSSTYVERKDFKGLQAFKNDFPIAKCYLIYTGTTQELHHDIMVLPIITALKELTNILYGSIALP